MMAEPIPRFVVGVVGSVGAVDALGELLSDLERFPWRDMAMVVAIHQRAGPGDGDPARDALQRAVGRSSHVHVHPLSTSTTLRPCGIYTCPPGCTVAISQAGEISCAEEARRAPLTLLSEMVNLAANGARPPCTKPAQRRARPTTQRPTRRVVRVRSSGRPVDRRGALWLRQRRRRA
jgi:hypothetical protein